MNNSVHKIAFSTIPFFIFLFAFVDPTFYENVKIPFCDFDSIEFSGKNTLKRILTIENGTPHGTTLEFDEYEEPKWIGNYNNGLKTGTWLGVDGGFYSYNKKGKNNSEPTYAGCGLGVGASQCEFFYEAMKILECNGIVLNDTDRKAELRKGIEIKFLEEYEYGILLELVNKTEVEIDYVIVTKENPTGCDYAQFGARKITDTLRAQHLGFRGNDSLKNWIIVYSDPKYSDKPFNTLIGKLKR